MGIPLVALMGRPPQIRDWGEQQNLNLQNQGLQQQVSQQAALAPGQQELQKQQIESQKRQLEQQQAINDAYKSAMSVDSQGQPTIDTNGLSKALALSGHGGAIPSILESVTNFQKSKQALIEQSQKIQEGQSDLLGHAAYAIKQAKYDPNVAHTILNELGDSPQIQQMRKIIDSNPQQFQQMVDTAIAQSPAQQKEQTTLDAAKIRAAGAAKEGELPLPNVDQMNQGLATRYQVLNPGKALPAQFTLPATATQKDFDRIDKMLTQTENAQGTKAQQDISNETRKQTMVLAQQARNDTRADKSYQFAAGQIDKVGKPIEDAVARFGRLQDTLGQKTPQADALVAPELLTVMAGGAGSGLRMNEAEISRIVGGRSNLESLKAALNKWQLDPSKALSITDSQRGQIQSLMSEVHGKLLQKQSILDESRQALNNANSPEQHRQIVTDTHKKLTQIDTGGGAATKSYTPPAGAKTATGPNGHKIVVDGGKWVDAATGKPI